MQKIFSSVILMMGITLIPLTSNAQENSGCFMLDANGQPLDLSHLCGGGSISNPNPNTFTPGLFQIPIKRREAGIPVIDVTFNGQKTFEMMVDTGASGTVLTLKMAQALKLQPEGAVIVNTPSQTNVPMPLSRVTSIATGGLIVENVVVAISPSLPMGLLGQDFLSIYDVTIKEKTIELRTR